MSKNETKNKNEKQTKGKPNLVSNSSMYGISDNNKCNLAINI